MQLGKLKILSFRSPEWMDYCFFISLLVAQLTSLHGKFFASYFLNRFSLQKHLLHEIENNLICYGIIFFISLIYFYLYISKAGPQLKTIIGAGIGFIAIGFIAELRNSTVITILFLFCYAATSFVIFISHCFEENLDTKFWEQLVSAFLKGTQFIIAVYGAGMLILRLIVQQGEDTVDGFLSTFLSATIAIVAIFFILGFWVFMPCWLKMVEGHKIKTPPKLKTSR